LFFKSNEQLIDFLSQAKTICDDYEKEICFLRNKLKECSSFNNLSVSESQPETNFLIDVSISNYFIKKLEEISKNATPDFNVLNTVYSEKITELFFENEKLDSQLKAFDRQEDKIKELEKTIDKLNLKVKDKEAYIDQMNGKYSPKKIFFLINHKIIKIYLSFKIYCLTFKIYCLTFKYTYLYINKFSYAEMYASKFTEIFNENDNLKKLYDENLKEIISLKNELEESNTKHLNEANSLLSEKKNIQNILDEKEKYFTKVKEDCEKEKKYHEDNHNANKHQIEELYSQMQQMEKELKRLNEAIESKNKTLEQNIKDYELIKEKYQNSEEENKCLLKDYQESNINYKRLVSAKEEIIENFDIKFSEKEQIYIKEQINLKEKIEEMEKEMIQKDFNLNKLKLDLENKPKNVVVIKDDINTKPKPEDNCLESELKEKISNIEKQNKILNDELSKKAKRIIEFEEEIKNIEKNLEKSKKKTKEASEEAENLREIIAKDQLRIKELKEFKEKALEGKIDLSSISAESSDISFRSKSNNENQQNIKTSDSNSNLVDKLNDEKSKNKVLCDEFRKLQENNSNLKHEISKKEKVIESNIKMIEELKLRLKNKIKLDEMLLNNKNRTNNTGVDNPNTSIGIGFNSINQFNEMNYTNDMNLRYSNSQNSYSEFNSDNRSESYFTYSENEPIRKSNVSLMSNEDNNESNKNNSNRDNKNESKIRVTFEQFNLCKMLMTENLLINYQLSQSISLNFIVDVLIKNFNFLFNTIFINAENSCEYKDNDKNTFKENLKNINKVLTDNQNACFNNSSSVFGLKQISIFHEFLEDVILKIYDIAIKSIIEKNSKDEQDRIDNEKNEVSLKRFKKTIVGLFSTNKNTKEDSQKKQDLYNLSKEDFSFELKKKITSEITENNILLNLINAQRSSKPNIQELFNAFIQKFDKFFVFEFLNISDKNTKYYEVINIKLEDYLNNEIKPDLIESIKNFNLNNKNKIQILIDKISQNIHDGLLLNTFNKSAVYKFQNFQKEYSELNFILRNNKSSNFIKSNSNTNQEDESSLLIDESENLNTLKKYDSISDIVTGNISESKSSTLIVNFKNLEKILSSRHSFDYFNFLVKSNNLEVTIISLIGDIKKNIDLKSFYILFLNILLYSKNVQKLTVIDIYLSSDSVIRENERLARNSIYLENINLSIEELTNFINYSNNLRYLNISNCFIGDEGLKYLCKNLSQNNKLIELNLTNNQLKENSGFYLAELLPNLKKLQSLILSDNSIRENGFTSLVTSISSIMEGSDNKEKTCSLRFLDLSSNLIKENESRAFLECLSKYDKLENVVLKGNSFCGQAANSIGIYLKIVKGLKKIDLSNCELNEESSPLLIKNLEFSQVEEIIMDSNPFGQIGAILLANVLRINKNIKILSLKNCVVTSMSMKLLAKNCENNTTVKEIDLRNNKINYEDFISINKLIEGKTFKFLLDEVKNVK